MPKHRGWRNSLIVATAAILLLFSMSAPSSAAASIGLVWLKDGYSAVQPALSGDGGVIAASGNKMIRLSKEGEMVWEWSAGNAVISSIAGDGTGGGWASSGRRIFRIGANGKLLWTYTWEGEITSLEPVQEGGIAAAAEKGAILVDRFGKFKWLYDPATGCDT